MLCTRKRNTLSKKVHRNDAQRKKVLRTNESSEVRQARLMKQLHRSRAHLKSQSAAERTDRCKRQLDHEIARNENESKARRISCLNYQRKYQAKLRGNTNDTFHNSARSAPASENLDSIVEEHSLESMPFPCSHCSAKFWQNEKLSTSTKNC